MIDLLSNPLELSIVADLRHFKIAPARNELTIDHRPIKYRYLSLFLKWRETGGRRVAEGGGGWRRKMMGRLSASNQRHLSRLLSPPVSNPQQIRSQSASQQSINKRETIRYGDIRMKLVCK